MNFVANLRRLTSIQIYTDGGSLLTVHKCLLFEQFICWQGKSSMAAHPHLVARKSSYEQLRTRRTALLTKFGDSGDSALPCHNSNSAATTNNPRPRTGRMSASLETTVEAGESLTGEPLRNPLPAKQRSSPTRPPWVRACASPDPYLKCRSSSHYGHGLLLRSRTVDPNQWSAEPKSFRCSQIPVGSRPARSRTRRHACRRGEFSSMCQLSLNWVRIPTPHLVEQR
jgi:hypothetical protein